MDFHVIHHHIYHNNGFNPNPSLSIAPPLASPLSRFNPFRLFDSCFRPAPICQYTFVYCPLIEMPQDAQKTNLKSNEHLSPQTSSQEPQAAERIVQDELSGTRNPESEETIVEEDLFGRLNLKETEDVVDDFVPIPEPDSVSNDFHYEENLIFTKNNNLKETLNLIQNGQTALNTSFTETTTSLSPFQGILAIRQAFWKELAKQAYCANNLENFGQEIEKQIYLDAMLISLLEEEAESSEKQKTPLKSTLGLISSYQNDDVFAYRIGVVIEKSDQPPLSEIEAKELKEGILETLIAAEKKENATFLQSLSKMKKRFELRGFSTIANHYRTMILHFKQIDKSLTQENAELYTNEWNALLKEFDPQHQFFLRLDKADKALENFSKTMQNQLNAIEEKQSSVIFQEINELTAFMNTKEMLKDSRDVEAYINKIYAFIQLSEAKLNISK